MIKQNDCFHILHVCSFELIQKITYIYNRNNTKQLVQLYPNFKSITVFQQRKKPENRFDVIMWI